jgi:ABC-2 type transport system permease protein
MTSKRSDGYAALLATYRADLRETLRSRWYRLYALAYGLLIVLFFGFGLSESSIMGFTGLSRSMLTFLQLTMLIMPVFILITTARTLVGDRDAGVWEYLLSWPFRLSSYFWGKALGRITIIATPLLLALIALACLGGLRGAVIPWSIVWTYGALMISMVVCFTGIAMFISVTASNQEFAIGLAFALWLLFEAAIDSLLLGLLVKGRLMAEVVVGLALLNPIQAFRTASIALFDPELTTLGSISFTLLDSIGKWGLMVWAIGWPLLLGAVFAWFGKEIFRKRDIVA